MGLTSMDLGEGETEFLHLEYAKDTKLYVPVSQLHVISRYTGMSEENAPLHKLGSDQWRKAKQKAIARIHDVAQDHQGKQARHGQDLAGRVKAWTAATSASQQLADEFAQWLERPDPSAILPI